MSDIWISRHDIDRLERLAGEKFPLETGGILAGYISDDDNVVVTHIVGPGAGAMHAPTLFQPDHTWQCAELEMLFHSSFGQIVYLGDWHTHPNGIPEMSGIDRRTLLLISIHPEASLSTPVMLIGGGRPGDWKWQTYRFSISTNFGLFRRIKPIILRVFARN